MCVCVCVCVHVYTENGLSRQDFALYSLVYCHYYYRKILQCKHAGVEPNRGIHVVYCSIKNMGQVGLAQWATPSLLLFLLPCYFKPILLDLLGTGKGKEGSGIYK